MGINSQNIIILNIVYFYLLHKTMIALAVPKALISLENNDIHEVKLKSGQIIQRVDDKCSKLLVLKEGCLRVFKRSKDGRMFTLYRVSAEECCGLTISCLLNKTRFTAVVEVEKDVTAYEIPDYLVRSFIQQDTEWQTYLFNQLSNKIKQLTELTDNFVFNNMESRIANLLCRRLKNSSNTNIIHITHQVIANEVGTSREVTSRSLNLLESKGLLELKRGKITVTNLHSLKNFSTDH